MLAIPASCWAGSNISKLSATLVGNAINREFSGDGSPGETA
jgi:hypothetical protein